MWKEKLDKEKRKIADHIAIDDRWNRTTVRYEFASHLKYYIKKGKCPPMMSNAYLKCWELLQLVERDVDWSGEIRHFDNAALPGDFIRATRDWVKRRDMQYDWRASSLIDPNDNTVLTDRFGLLKNHPECWMMLPEGKQDLPDRGVMGDVCDAKVRAHIVKRLAPMKVNLYTSDLGFKFEDRFNEEGEHYAANVGQIELGLACLDVGGVFITKQFGMFNVETQDLIKKCASRFKKFMIIKPETSKADNSEMYLVGIGFLGMDVEPRAINIDFDAQIEAFSYAQVRKIRSNLQMYKSGRRAPNMQPQIKQWINKNRWY